MPATETAGDQAGARFHAANCGKKPVFTDLHREIIVDLLVAKTAGHAATARVDFMDFGILDTTEQRLHRARAKQCFLMAMAVAQEPGWSGGVVGISGAEVIFFRIAEGGWAKSAAGRRIGQWRGDRADRHACCPVTPTRREYMRGRAPAPLAATRVRVSRRASAGSRRFRGPTGHRGRKNLCADAALRENLGDNYWPL